MAMVLLLAAKGSPLWYTSRAAGTVTLLLLTITVILGIATTTRREAIQWPRFLNPGMHRNLSLLALLFLGLHVITSVLDPYAHLGLRDVVVPFASSYRPLWLGLGVVAAEVTLAVAATSALRGRIGYRAWRLLHWVAYACWPIALLHGLGTGSDVTAIWFQVVTVASVAAVFLALVHWRLPWGWPRLAPVRMVIAVTLSLALVALVLWTASGPLLPGWARVAGTPIALLKSP